jgi:hypothetical protein
MVIALQFKDITEASLSGSKSIAMYCKRAGTVKRLIYTGSVVSASPLKDDGTGFKDVILDETCWTPLNDSLAYLYHDAYVKVSSPPLFLNFLEYFFLRILYKIDL